MLNDEVGCLHVERNILVGASYLDIEDLDERVKSYDYLKNEGQAVLRKKNGYDKKNSMSNV